MWEDIWWEEITGMIINKFQLSMEVGSLPKTNFTICMNALVEKQSDENLEKLKGLVEKEIKRRKDMIPSFKNFKIEIRKKK